MREVATFSASTYLFDFLALLRGLIVARFLGPSLYGLWSFIRTFFSNSVFLNLGTNEAMLREVPYNNGKQFCSVNVEIFNTNFTWNLLISFLVFGLLIVIVSLTGLSHYKTLFFLAGIAVILNSSNVFIASKLKSEQKIIHVSRYYLAYGVLNFILGLCLLFFFEIKGLLAGMIISNVIVFFYLFKKKELPLRLHINLHLLSHLIKTGFPMMTLASTFVILHNIDKTIIFLILGKSATGYFALAAFLAEIINHIPNALTAVLFPRMMKKIGKTNDYQHIEEFFTKPMLIMSFLVPVVIGLLFINIDIPILFFLPSYNTSIDILRITLLGLFFGSICSIPRNILIASNKQSKFMKHALALIIVACILDYVVLKMGYGVVSIAVASVFIHFIFTSLTIFFALHELGKETKFIISKIFRIYYPFGYAVLCLFAVSWLKIQHIILTDIIRSIVFVALTFPLVYYAEKHTNFLRIFVCSLNTQFNKKGKTGSNVHRRKCNFTIYK